MCAMTAILPQRIVHVRPGTGERTRTQSQTKQLRVAAYCRVSTDDEEQLTSYKTQIDYYTQLIEENPNWTMVEVFADEGISGTMAKKRPEFMRLMKLCEQGKVDLILTKSVSRFARNSLDSITYVRKLKLMGIGVIFAKENLNTLNMTNEMIFTIWSAFAQAESESLSENVKMGKRNGLKNAVKDGGSVPLPHKNLLGYDRDKNKLPVVVPEEAAIVRRIYASYLAGYSIAAIKTELEADGIPTKSGGKAWSQAVISYILQNEKYVGDILLQKTFVVDCISKKVQKNNGEVAQYYIENNHEGIIPRELFHRVQEERARRSSKRKVADNTKTERGKYSGKYALTELLTCSECGTRYRRCTWKRGGKTRIVWRCISRLEHGTTYCKHSPTLDEAILQDAIVQAMNNLLDSRDDVETALRECLIAASAGFHRTIDRAAIQQQLKDSQQRMLDMTKLCATDPTMLERLDEVFAGLSKEQEALQATLREDDTRIVKQEQKSSRLQELLPRLHEFDHHITAYSEETTRKLIDSIKVISGEELQITFRGGMEVTASLTN